MIARLRASRRESGAAAVEFALILVVLVPLLFGIIQYGMYFWSQSAATSAAREATRRATVGEYSNCTDFRTYVVDELGAAGSDPVTTTRSYAKAGGNTGTGVQIGDTMTVKVQFDAFDLGLIPLPLAGKVEATTTARVENVTTPPETCA